MILTEFEVYVKNMIEANYTDSRIALNINKTLQETKLIVKNLCKKLAGKID